MKRSTGETLAMALVLGAIVFAIAWFGRGCARDEAERDCAGRGHLEQVHGGRGGWVCVTR